VPGGATDWHVVNIVDDAPTTVYEIAGIVGATYEPSADPLPNRWIWRHCSNAAPTMASPKPGAIERLAAAPTDEGLVLRDIWLLRLRALLARAHGDDTAYRDYREPYRAMATSLGFEGHMKWAEAMP
jgi:hypothetical protein